LQRLSRLNVAASSGAACSSGGSEPSHVLTAMGVPRDEALCAIRFSLGDETRAEDIALLLNSLPALIEPLLSVAAES
ncbi:MAG: cysteine desulfurase NifS, partial [Hydrogenophaga sp.]|nr:cysteine desulfurase NifS [Hydrogenophaga sp.]